MGWVLRGDKKESRLLWQWGGKDQRHLSGISKHSHCRTSKSTHRKSHKLMLLLWTRGYLLGEWFWRETSILKIIIKSHILLNSILYPHSLLRIDNLRPVEFLLCRTKPSDRGIGRECLHKLWLEFAPFLYWKYLNIIPSPFRIINRLNFHPSAFSSLNSLSTYLCLKFTLKSRSLNSLALLIFLNKIYLFVNKIWSGF